MTVGAFPYSGLEPLALTIDYIRLAINAEIRTGVIRMLQEVGEKIGDKAHYQKAIQFLERDPPIENFPQAPTTRQSFKPEEFQAYKAIGRYLVRRYFGGE
jgi:hypothetical protein